MLELIPNKTTNEPKDLIPPSSNQTSLPGTSHDSTCKRRLALSEELSQLTLSVQATNTDINNYKDHGVSHSFLIAHQLQMQAVYAKDMQHVWKDLTAKERPNASNAINSTLHQTTAISLRDIKNVEMLIRYVKARSKRSIRYRYSVSTVRLTATWPITRNATFTTSPVKARTLKQITLILQTVLPTNSSSYIYPTHAQPIERSLTPCQEPMPLLPLHSAILNRTTDRHHSSPA
ncbi:hypothetical protein TNCV_3894191 [Trichonephila clavipes]|nr:hypothetical protein TNCV_3894191 [Trichonephila clavipes]